MSGLCGIGIDEIARLEQAALTAQTDSLSEGDDADERMAPRQPATAQDEVQARVDTAIMMRRLEKFFATLPPRERRVIDAYLGVGLTPMALAGELGVSRSRVSQMYKAACRRIAQHFGQAEPEAAAQRAADRGVSRSGPRFDEMIELREAQLAAAPDGGQWGEMLESALTPPRDQPCNVGYRTDSPPKFN